MNKLHKKIAMALMLGLLVLVSVAPAAAGELTDDQPAELLTRKVNEYEGQHR